MEFSPPWFHCVITLCPHYLFGFLYHPFPLFSGFLLKEEGIGTSRQQENTGNKKRKKGDLSVSISYDWYQGEGWLSLDRSSWLEAGEWGGRKDAKGKKECGVELLAYQLKSHRDLSPPSSPSSSCCSSFTSFILSLFFILYILFHPLSSSSFFCCCCKSRQKSSHFNSKTLLIMNSNWYQLSVKNIILPLAFHKAGDTRRTLCFVRKKQSKEAQMFLIGQIFFTLFSFTKLLSYSRSIGIVLSACL